MNAAGESDDLVVPAKQANKGGTSPSAESVEERGSAEGNTFQLTAYRTQSRKGVSIELEGVRRVASRDKEVRFTALLHHVTERLLTISYRELNPKAVPGVDEVTWEEYGHGLEERIRDLHNRVQSGYRAQPSKRIYLPKPDGRQRPIGIATVTGKRTPVQSAFGLRGNHSSVSSASKTAVCRAQMPDGFGGGVCDPERLAFRNFFGAQGLDFDPLQRSLPGRRRGANDLAVRVSAGAMRVREDARRISL